MLRKVPRWLKKNSLPNASSLADNGYPTGYNANYSPSNSETNWITKKDYYAGVFMVTKAQYCKVFGKEYNASTDMIPAIQGNYWSSSAGRYITWNTLRDSELATNTIPVSSDGGFFSRLKYKTGGRYNFDIPTLIMSEIAARAGNRSRYFWGDDTEGSASYVVYNASDAIVGSKSPNSWGLYDVAGNGFEWCLDDDSLSDVAMVKDPFSPASNGVSGQRLNRGGPAAAGTSIDECSASYYRKNGRGTSNNGFRVFVIMD